ncbi:MAG: hypothetical protein HY070_05465 [Chloroflexi bacterium]|nr:hypothetical protein [Chloroflexota bacterium]
MRVTTFKGIVEKGKIKLQGNVRLPEKTRVYVVVPDLERERPARISSPRLARREQAQDFRMEIVE